MTERRESVEQENDEDDTFEYHPFLDIDRLQLEDLTHDFVQGRLLDFENSYLDSLDETEKEKCLQHYYRQFREGFQKLQQEHQRFLDRVSPEYKDLFWKVGYNISDKKGKVVYPSMIIDPFYTVEEHNLRKKILNGVDDIYRATLDDNELRQKRLSNLAIVSFSFHHKDCFEVTVKTNFLVYENGKADGYEDTMHGRAYQKKSKKLPDGKKGLGWKAYSAKAYELMHQCCAVEDSVLRKLYLPKFRHEFEVLREVPHGDKDGPDSQDEEFVLERSSKKATKKVKSGMATEKKVECEKIVQAYDEVLTAIADEDYSESEGDDDDSETKIRERKALKSKSRKKTKRKKSIVESSSQQPKKQKKETPSVEEQLKIQFKTNTKSIQPLLERWMHGIIDDEKEKVAKVLKELKANAGSISPFFLEFHEIGFLRNKTKKLFSGDSAMMQTLKEYNEVMKKSYTEQKKNMPNNLTFHDLDLKNVKSVGARAKKLLVRKSEMTTNAVPVMPLKQASIDDSVQDIPKIARVESRSAQTKKPAAAVVSSLQKCKPSAPSFMLKELISKHPSENDPVSCKPNDKPMLQEWLSSTSPLSPPLDSYRQLGTDFFREAVQLARPPEEVNKESMCLNIEASLHRHLMGRQIKELGESPEVYDTSEVDLLGQYRKEYWNRIRLIAGAFAGDYSNNGGTLMQAVLNGEISDPEVLVDSSRMPEHLLISSFQGIPIDISMIRRDSCM